MGKDHGGKERKQTMKHLTLGPLWPAGCSETQLKTNFFFLDWYLLKGPWGPYSAGKNYHGITHHTQNQQEELRCAPRGSSSGRLGIVDKRDKVGPRGWKEGKTQHTVRGRGGGGGIWSCGGSGVSIVSIYSFVMASGQGIAFPNAFRFVFHGLGI